MSEPRLSITPPTLRMGLVHFSHTHRGISVIGSWIKWNGRMQPCMVLLDASRAIRRGRTIPCVIPLDEAFRWVWHPVIGDPEHVRETCRDWMRSGALPGNEHSVKDAFIILDAVQSRLLDLYKMPPAPPLDKVVIGELLALDPETGRVVFEKEATADV